MKNFGLIFFLIGLINLGFAQDQTNYYAVSEVYLYPNCTGLTGFNVVTMGECFLDGTVHYNEFWSCNSTNVNVTICDDPQCNSLCQSFTQIPMDSCTSNTNSIVGDYEKIIGCWENDKPTSFPSDVYLSYTFYSNDNCDGEPYSYAYINATCYYDPLFGQYFKNECNNKAVPSVWDCGQSANCSDCTRSANDFKDSSFCYSFTDTIGFYLRCGPVNSVATIEFNKVIILMAILLGMVAY